MATEDLFQKGWETLNKINSTSGERILKMLEKIAIQLSLEISDEAGIVPGPGGTPDMARLVIEFPFGDIYSRPGLDLRTRELITIVSLTTLGYPHNELKAHISNALKADATQQEIIEVIMQMAV